MSKKPLSNYTDAEIFAMVAQREFHPFDSKDWDSFAGVSADKPLISYGDEVTIIVDGSELVLVDNEGEQELSFCLTYRYRF